MPERTCVVCRREVKKEELLRFVVNQGEVEADLLAVKAGRGAYLCKTTRCLNDKAGLARIKGVLELGSKSTKGERKKLFVRSKVDQGPSVRILDLIKNEGDRISNSSSAKSSNKKTAEKRCAEIIQLIGKLSLR